MLNTTMRRYRWRWGLWKERLRWRLSGVRIDRTGGSIRARHDGFYDIYTTVLLVGDSGTTPTSATYHQIMYCRAGEEITPMAVTEVTGFLAGIPSVRLQESEETPKKRA